MPSTANTFKIYAVYDTVNKEYWKTWRHNSFAFGSIAGAKNSFNQYKPCIKDCPDICYTDEYGNIRRHNFNQQSRFVIHELTPNFNSAKVVG